MHNGNWRTLLAAFALLTLGSACTHSKVTAEQKQSDPRIGGAHANITSNYNHQAALTNILPESQPCGPEQYGNNSELCAEWKAADAADTAAWWSRLSGMLGIFSLFVVAGALRLTIISNRIAVDSANRQLRAYMGLKAGMLRKFDTAEAVEVELEFENAGQTPAYDAYVVGGMFVAAHPDGEMLFRDLTDHVAGRCTVGPGGRFRKSETGNVPQDWRDRMREGTAVLYVYGRLHYNDAFGASHISHYRLFCGKGHPNWITQKDGVTVGRLVPDTEGNNSD